MTKIFIAIPNTGQINVDLTAWLIEIAGAFSYSINFVTGKDTITARNELVVNFLKSDCTHLFFVDSDMSPNDFEALEKLHGLNLDIVSGYTHQICPKTGKVINNFREPVEQNGLLKVSKVGAACLLIKRKVFENLAMDEKLPAFEVTRINGMLVESEDFYFCRKVTELGFEIYVHPKVVFNHWKVYSLMAVAENG